MMRRQSERRRNVGMCASRAAFNAITLEGRTLTTSMTLDSKSQLFSHFGAQRLPIVLGIFLRIPAEFQNGDENGKGQAAQQHHKHSADVLHTQSIRLWFFILLVATADFYMGEKRNNMLWACIAYFTSHPCPYLQCSSTTCRKVSGWFLFPAARESLEKFYHARCFPWELLCHILYKRLRSGGVSDGCERFCDEIRKRKINFYTPSLFT